jgi:tRNA threonylcarbamoyladenosine biosynthesis protein TsaB
MNLLAIDTAITRVSVALVTENGRVRYAGDEPRRHTESLAPAIARLCASQDLAVRDLDVVAVDIGPGLFNALRVGVATAKGLAQAGGLGCWGCSSLEVLAHQARAVVGERRVASVIDARRGMVFVGLFGADGTEEPLDLDALATPPDALAALARLDDVVVCGDGAWRYRAELDAAGLVGCPDALEPDADALADIALARVAAGDIPLAAAELAVDYRRPADVRIGWEQRPA